MLNFTDSIYGDRDEVFTPSFDDIIVEMQEELDYLLEDDSCDWDNEYEESAEYFRIKELRSAISAVRRQARADFKAHLRALDEAEGLIDPLPAKAKASGFDPDVIPF